MSSKMKVAVNFRDDIFVDVMDVTAINAEGPLIRFVGADDDNVSVWYPVDRISFIQEIK